MTTFLLVISFLLHFIALIAIVILSVRVSKTKELELKQEKVAREVEETFTAYLLEIKEENERLMNILEQSGQTDVADKQERATEETGYRPPVPDAPQAQENHSFQETLEEQSKKHREEKPQKVEDPSPIEETNASDYQKEEAYQPSLQSSVFQMYDQGYSTEQIAKRLDCGKTEVELMLKIHPKMKQ